jgi:hypothetical protein
MESYCKEYAANPEQFRRYTNEPYSDYWLNEVQKLPFSFRLPTVSQRLSSIETCSNVNGRILASWSRHFSNRSADSGSDKGLFDEQSQQTMIKNKQIREISILRSAMVAYYPKKAMLFEDISLALFRKCTDLQHQALYAMGAGLGPNQHRRRIASVEESTKAFIAQLRKDNAVQGLAQETTTNTLLRILDERIWTDFGLKKRLARAQRTKN